jgi:hypothetical protein
VCRAQSVDQMKVSVEILESSSAARIKKIESGGRLLEKILNTELFKSRVVGYVFNGVRGYVDSDGRTNEQVFNLIMEGSEVLSPGIDHTANIKITFYYRPSSTVAQTSSRSLVISFNKKYLDQFDVVEVAGTLMHEWLHKLGFGHSYRYNNRRDHSIPYAIGYIVRDIGEDLIMEQDNSIRR